MAQIINNYKIGKGILTTKKLQNIIDHINEKTVWKQVDVISSLLPFSKRSIRTKRMGSTLIREGLTFEPDGVTPVDPTKLYDVMEDVELNPGHYNKELKAIFFAKKPRRTTSSKKAPKNNKANMYGWRGVKIWLTAFMKMHLAMLEAEKERLKNIN